MSCRALQTRTLVSASHLLRFEAEGCTDTHNLPNCFPSSVCRYKTEPVSSRNGVATANRGPSGSDSPDALGILESARKRLQGPRHKKLAGLYTCYLKSMHVQTPLEYALIERAWCSQLLDTSFALFLSDMRLYCNNKFFVPVAALETIQTSQNAGM